MSKEPRHHKRIAEIEAIARRIKSGENGCLYERLVNLYIPYLRTLYRYWRYPQVSFSEFDDLCRGGVDRGLAEWDGTIPLHWKVKNTFQKACRARWKRDSVWKLSCEEFDEFLLQYADTESGKGMGELVTKEVSQIVRAELLKEKPPCPKIVRMRFEDWMRFREISEKLGLSEAGCRGVFHRNKEAVKKRLSREYPEIFGLLPSP